MQNKILQIQGVRALAMLCIFTSHTAVWLPETISHYASHAGLGRLGVVTFFMIAGFLLAYKKRSIPVVNRRDAIHAAWGKTGKMYFLYLVTFLVAFLSKFPSSSLDWMKASISMVFTLSMTQAFVPFSWVIHAFNGPAWFLSALFGIWILIYIFPNNVNKLLALPIGKSCVTFVLFLFAQIIWVGMAKNFVLPMLSKHHYLLCCYDWIVYYNPVFCFSEFCAGVLIGNICAQRQYPVLLQNILAIMAFLLIIIYLSMRVMGLKLFFPWVVYIECAVGVGFMAMISPHALGSKMLSNHALVWFGDISGYFFLIHGATNFAMQATIAKYITRPWLFFISLIISTLLSVLADWFYTSKDNKLLCK